MRSPGCGPVIRFCDSLTRGPWSVPVWTSARGRCITGPSLCDRGGREGPGDLGGLRQGADLQESAAQIRESLEI